MQTALGSARKLAVNDEDAQSGIVFVLRIGIPREDLPPISWVRQWYELLVAPERLERHWCQGLVASSNAHLLA